jgi:hypothetical protein
LAEETTTPNSIIERSYTRYNIRRKNNDDWLLPSHDIGHAVSPWTIKMQKCRMALSAWHFNGFELPKN